MKARFPSVLVFALLASALLVAPLSAATSVFATGMTIPETISQAASGDFYVTDADTLGPIWKVPAGGGAAQQIAQAGYDLRGGLFLPASFGLVGGEFLVVGNGAASTMNSSFTVTPYHTQANTVWTQPVLAPSFGSLSGDVLVTNQGATGQGVHGSVDYFTPSGTVGRLATFSLPIIPFGAALAGPSFGEVGGPSLFVSDAGGNGIYTVDTVGNVRLFATIPLATGQTGLRQIAFAPTGWGKYSGDLFVSITRDDIDVLNRDGSIIGKISGAFNPRGLLFTTIAGNPRLLFSNTRVGNMLIAGPGDVVPVAH